MNMEVAWKYKDSARDFINFLKERVILACNIGYQSIQCRLF